MSAQEKLNILVQSPYPDREKGSYAAISYATIGELQDLIEKAIDEARQEGWSDGYFEGGGLQ